MIGRLKDHSFKFKKCSISNVSRDGYNLVLYKNVFGVGVYVSTHNAMSRIVAFKKQLKATRDKISKPAYRDSFNCNSDISCCRSHIIRPFKKYKSINYFRTATIRSKCKREI